MQQYEVQEDVFIVHDYNNAKPFSSFLPSVAGLWGKPLWVYYVNRAQGVANFGVRDKDGAMLEFTAANKAYRHTPQQGFRTFYRLNETYYEPFRYAYKAGYEIVQTMYIKAGSVKFTDRNEKLGIETSVEYFILTNERFPALMRNLRVKNISSGNIRLDCLDGLPGIVPCGTPDWILKNMSRLGEAWFKGVDFSPCHKVPVYKLPVEPADRPEIVPVKGGNFYAACYEQGGSRAYPVYFIDPDTIFGNAGDFSFPQKFLESGTGNFRAEAGYAAKNKTPSAMGYFSCSLESGEDLLYRSAFAYAAHAGHVDSLVEILFKKDMFELKRKENDSILDELGRDVYTKSAFPRFDAYVKQNYIDNILRGGYPVFPGSEGFKKAYYVYSRVHGDMEREYNNFILLPEYYSQGNGNFRDINQNRRSGVFFNQEVGTSSILFFMNCIQLDGFNPFKIMGVKFAVRHIRDFLEEAGKYFPSLGTRDRENMERYLARPVTIGGFFDFIEERNITIQDKNALLNVFADHSDLEHRAEYGEGYWSDHWHYNMDLIENYLAVFPDRADFLFFGQPEYTFYDDCYFVEPRSKKHVLFQGTVKQFDAVSRDEKKEALISARGFQKNVVRCDFGKGDILKTDLFNKLLSLAANKYASLDPSGCGIEMEAGRSAWLDALNGLPGDFGSSLPESMELLRLLRLLKTVLDGAEKNIVLLFETAEYLRSLKEITVNASGDFIFWDKTHETKEAYRERTRFGLSGNTLIMGVDEIREIMDLFAKKLETALSREADSPGLLPTYYSFVPEGYEILKDRSGKSGLPCVRVHSFKRNVLPLFLEGPVHYLRLGQGDMKGFHQKIMRSPLYDKKLGMLKLNESLAETEGLGRIAVFTPGWLENESVWLHMEYKYLLELLRNNLSGEFFSLARGALVPFFVPDIYGRSIFENSSFLVSSAHPEEKIHGQGFQPRLSGATAEFISIWIAMTSGLRPFTVADGSLCLELKPQLGSEYFTVPENEFVFTFLGKTTVVYRNDERKDTFGPEGIGVKNYELEYADGRRYCIKGPFIKGGPAVDIRNGEVKQIFAALGA
jgi:hypothetical protein